MSSGDRVQKWLARAGAAPSRRKAEALIEAGRVSVDGAVVELGARVPDGAEVRLDGRLVAPPSTGRVLILHKPAGVVTTLHDPHGRPTVMELVPHVPGLHPVGRLDLDSEGLLLLTDDGALTQRLTHPSFEHRKRYRVWCRGGTPDADARARLRRGVELDDGFARADRVRGRRMATVAKCRFDLEVCGGVYVNAPCVIDGNLVSGRTFHDHGHYVGPWIRLLEEWRAGGNQAVAAAAR